MLNIESRFGNKNAYQLNRAQLKNINFNGENISQEPEKKQEKRRDIYMEMPVRALGYTNEVGEALRPVIGKWAWASWVPAIAYIGSDVADKYSQDEYGNQVPSGERATKQLSNQLLASVILPTVAVKAGQTAVDMGSGLTKNLAFSKREKISEFVLNAMDRGEHKNFLNKTGSVDKSAFSDSLKIKMGEKIKHKEVHNSMLKPLYAIKEWLAEPFLRKPNAKNIGNGINSTVERLVNDRQDLLEGIKPKKMSDKMFERFQYDSSSAVKLARKAADKAGKTAEELNAAAQSAKQSVAFDYIKKMEKSHNFKNKILLSAGGFIALSLLAKPIDHFVENVVIKKAVEPTISFVKNKTSGNKAEKTEA